MKKANGITTRIAAMLLSGMMVIGSVPAMAFGSEIEVNPEPGQTTDVVVEDTGENIPEGEVVEQYSDVVPQEEVITSYTVTLDANGGYFANEWDDALNETVETAETVTKMIPVGGSIVSFPVLEQENTVVTFLGWSLVPNGELVSQGYEEYVPVDNCVLYAVWQVEEIPVESEEADVQEEEQVEDVPEDIPTEDQQESEYNNELINEALDDETSEEPNATSGETENVDETSNDGDYQVDTSQDTIEEEGQEESFSTIAAMGVVASGTCGDNLTWTLDEEGTLTISGTGEMEDFSESNVPWASKRSEIKVIDIQNGITSIGVYAFSNCVSLKSITIPESIAVIWNYAFKNCKSLESIKLPSSMTCIEIGVFSNCSSLKSVTLPNTVTMINGSAFYGCTSLTNITIPNSIKTIYSQAFLGCTKLKSIFFTGNALTINDTVFKKVTATAYYPANDPTWTEDKRQNCGGSITWVPWNPENELISFGTCGANVTWILDKEGELTITGRGSMNDYEKESDKYAPWYDNKDNIKKVIIDNLVSSIGTDAFFDCNNLCEVSIGTGVNSIGSAAFKSCNNLEKITIPGNVSKIGLWAFSYCDKLKDVTIDNGVSIIGSQAFYLCSSLNSIVIPDSTTEFGNLTFYKCSSLKNVKIGNGSTKIGGSCFSQCTSLSDVVIGEKISTIESGVFSGCRSLKTIQLPETINKLESHAFYNCSNIKEIHFEGSAPSFATDTFEGVTATAYYPANDPTWTEAIRQNYGGNITWIPWDPETGIVNPVEDGIKTLIPSNNSVDVDHSVNPKIVFSEALRFSGNGHISLFESNNSTPVETIEAVTSSHAVIIEPSNEEDTSSTLDLYFDTELKPNTKYTISIDSGSLEYLRWDSISREYVETGKMYAGIEKGVWSFSTSEIDYMHFPNQTEEIDEDLYYYLFKPGKAFLYSRVWDSSRGKKGTCYGWAYTVGAKRQQYNSINAFGGRLCELKIDSLNLNNNYSLLNYIQMAYLYQFSERKLKEDKQNKDKFDRLYQAIKNQINGNGEDIIIGVYEGKNGHALYPVNIISENENEINVQVLDCNRPEDSYFANLILKKESNRIKGYEYKTYDDHISFDTIDNVLDNAFCDPSRTEQETTNLVYSTSPLNNSNLNEIIPKGDSVSESNLYWTEQTSVTQPGMNNTTIGMTDGYSLIETNVENAADISIDLLTNSASVESIEGGPVGFSISYTSYDVDGSDSEMTIKSETELGVETQQTEDGIVISSEGNNYVEVSDGDNTVGFETNDAPVLVKTDGAITVYEDSNNDGSYTNAVEVAPIGKIKINENSIKMSYFHDLTYNGNEINAISAVTYGNKSLTEGTDYEVAYTDNINAGTATVTITGIGNYEGNVTKTFTINPAPIDSVEVSEIKHVTYTGKEQTPAPTVKIEEKDLTQDKDFTVSYSNNTNAGTATVTLSGKGNYTGTKTVTFEIKPAALSEVEITALSDKTYTGQAITQAPIVKVGSTTLIEGTDYTVSYKDNTNPGIATVTMTGKGNYTGTKEVTFTINAVGWIQKSGEWYYYKNDGTRLTNGWAKDSKGWYWLDASGKITKSKWIKSGGSWYYLGSDGIMTTGWQKVGGKWYYMNSSGIMTTGWQKVGGKWYYMNASGIMTTGWQKVGGKWYYMNSSGIMTTGWQKVDGKWYYMNSSGIMTTGWQKVGNNWYYMNSSGIMTTGWQKVAGNWYYMNSSGIMTTGWQKIGGKWYYMKSSGIMTTGWHVISGKWYYFDASGVWIR